MEYDEYEALPQNSTVLTHMLAGAAAGIMEHSCMYPIDSVKTRMQSLVSYKLYEGKNLFQCLRHIAKTEGFWRPIRGLNVVVVGAGPAHALYFSTYEALKKILTIPNTPLPSNHGTNGPDFKNVLAHGVAGMAATLLHDAIMNPVEVVKQRMQTLNSPYCSSGQCFLGVLRREGVRAFYRSYPTQVALNVPFQCTHFITYELGQDVLNPNRSYNLPAHLLSGAIAGGLAAAITTPLDVCKTLLNTQEITCDLAGVTCTSKVNTRGIASPLDSLKGSSSFEGNKESARSAHNFPSLRSLPNTNNNSSPSRIKPSLFPFMKMGVTVLSTRSSARSPPLNNNSGNKHSYSVVRGLIQAARTVHRVRGPPGFFQGLQARVVYQMPATALSWSVYEFFKFALTKQNGDGKSI